MGKTTDRIKKLASPVADSFGLELVDVEFVKEGNNWTLRVFIEDPEGETDLEDCEAVSRKLSDLLDEKDPIEQSYILEVSSPGLERPLKKKADFDRFRDRLVAIKTYAPIKGEKEFKGILLKREGEDIFIKNDQEDVIKIPFDKIASAHLVIDFG